MREQTSDRRGVPAILAVLALALSGCVPTKPVAPPPPVLTAAEQAALAIEAAGKQALQAGIDAFAAGDYLAAEQELLSSELWKAGESTRVEALKYLGFTYCVNGKPAACRRAFERALQIDPRFALGEAEASHPIWGPQFAKAKGQGE